MVLKLSDTQVEKILYHQEIGRLGCYANDLVYVVPINYAYDGCYVYAHTYDSLKIDIMRINPNVCFEVDTMHNTSNWQSVTAWGEFEELTDEEERNMGLQILMKRMLPAITCETVKMSSYSSFPPSGPNEIKGIVFRLRLTMKYGRHEVKEPALFSTSNVVSGIFN